MKNSFIPSEDFCFIVVNHKGKKLLVSVDHGDREKTFSIRGTWNVKWNPTAKTFYCRTQIGGRKNTKTIYLHRLLLGVRNPRVLVDHADHNGLNNRRGNLRRATKSTNGFNRRGAAANSRSQRRNVYWNAREKKWMVWLLFGGVRYYAGYFKDLETADQAAQDLRKKAVSA